MLWGQRKVVGARRLARPRLPGSKPGGSAIPREPRADKNGVPDRLRSGDLLHERQACWLDYTTGTKDGEGKRICTFDLMHVTHPLCWLSYALKQMVGTKSAALFASRMSNERSADELRPQKWSG